MGNAEAKCSMVASREILELSDVRAVRRQLDCGKEGRAGRVKEAGRVLLTKGKALLADDGKKTHRDSKERCVIGTLFLLIL